MADILDYIFFFWVFVCGAVYFCGLIYEQQLELKIKEQKKKEAKRKREAQLDQDRSWSAGRSQYAAGLSETGLYGSSVASQFGITTDSQYSTSYKLQTSPQFDSHGDIHPHELCVTGQLDEARLGSSGHWHELGDDTGRGYNQSIPSGSVPTASGFNSDRVDWVNSVLLLFYSQPQKYGDLLAESVIRSLNEKLVNLMSNEEDLYQQQQVNGSGGDRNKLLIEFLSINKQNSSRPELTNIRTDNESDKSVSVSCKLYNQQLSLELAVRRPRDPLSASKSASLGGTDQQEAHYELTLENLEAKLKAVAILNDKLIVVQFMEKPETKILLRMRPTASYSPIINEDSLVSLVLQTLTQIVVDLYFGDDTDFPVFRHHQTGLASYMQKLSQLKGSANEIKRHIKQDFFGALSSSSTGDKERKISVKILNAKNINYNQNVTCLLELDSPYQQASSSTKPASSNPHWDEHFLFYVNDKSQELCIELWDSVTLPKEYSATSGFGSLKRAAKLTSSSEHHGGKRWVKQEVVAGAKFLGLVRLNVEEMRRNPMQKVSLYLEAQSHAVASDLSNSVGGELELELMFLEHSSAIPSQETGLQKSHSISSISIQQGDIVAVDRKLTPSGFVITTTTITKPANSNQTLGDSRRPRDRLSVARNQSPTSSEDPSVLESTTSGQQVGGDGLSSIGDTSATGGVSPQPHRSRSRSRSLLRAIKKRFSFSRTRSRSVGESGGGRQLGPSTGGSPSASNLPDGATSVESRSRASSVASAATTPGGRAKSVPACRDPSELPTIVINKGRLSDTASAFSFAHPKSQLIVECREPAGLAPDGSGNMSGEEVRHYVIPDEASLKKRWRKRGIKLHVLNAHQFVAQRMAGSSTCHLCGRVFSRRPGKQGYKCRNCHLLSHKECHVRVDHQCPYATEDSLRLEYIDADPPAKLLDLANRQSNESLPTNRTPQRRPHLGAKSISVDVDDR